MWVFEWRKYVHYLWSYVSFAPECKELTCMTDPLLYRWDIPPVVIRCVHWTMQRGVLQTWITPPRPAIVLSNLRYWIWCRYINVKIKSCKFLFYWFVGLQMCSLQRYLSSKHTMLISCVIYVTVLCVPICKCDPGINKISFAVNHAWWCSMCMEEYGQKLFLLNYSSNNNCCLSKLEYYDINGIDCKC